jgi:type II secretory pathway component PulJ
MKSIIAVATLSLFTFNTYAAKTVQCKLQLTENKIKCSLGLLCQYKSLKESSIELREELEDGQNVSGQIHLHKVVVRPGTSDQKNYNVFLFEGDHRAQKLQEKENVDLVQFKTNETLRYNIQSTGNTLNIEFKGAGQSVYRFNISGQFNEWLNGWVQVRLLGNEDFQEKIQPILLSCRQVSTLAIKQGELEKQAIEAHLKKKESKSQATYQ